MALWPPIESIYLFIRRAESCQKEAWPCRWGEVLPLKHLDSLRSKLGPRNAGKLGSNTPLGRSLILSHLYSGRLDGLMCATQKQYKCMNKFFRHNFSFPCGAAGRVRSGEGLQLWKSISFHVWYKGVSVCRDIPHNVIHYRLRHMWIPNPRSFSWTSSCHSFTRLLPVPGHIINP